MRTLIVLLAACGGSKPPQNMPELDPPKAVVSSAEPFALAEIVYDIDVFAETPQVELPSDATMHIGSQYTEHKTIGEDLLKYSQHQLSITLNDDYARFEHDIAPQIAAAVKLPPATALVWARSEDDQSGPQFRAVVVKTPPLLSTGDLATAQDVPWKTMTINLSDDRKSKVEEPHAVKVTLHPDSAAVYARWRGEHPGVPYATILYGRVAELEEVTSRAPTDALPRAEDVATFVVQIKGVPPYDTRTVASTLAKTISERGSERKH